MGVLNQAELDAIGGDQVARTGSRAAVLKGLRFRPMPSAVPIADLPKITLGIDTTTIADGTTYPANNPRMTLVGGTFALRGQSAPLNQYYSIAYISRPTGDKVGSDWSVRFLTDAPFFEVVMGDFTSSVGIAIDGMPISTQAPIRSNANSAALRFLRLEFSPDVQTIKPTIARASGGTGYATGDVLSINGGTGLPMIIVVTDITAGTGELLRYYIRDYGQYSAVPGNGVGVTAITGSGTGATFNVGASSNPLISRQRTRRMRSLEVTFTNNAAFGGIRVPTNSLLRPWPLSGVRLMTMQDSYNDTYQDFPRGAWSGRLATRLGIDDLWINGVGGSSFLTAVNGTYPYPDRLGDVISNQPPAHVPFVFLTQGSINELGSPSDAAVTAAVTAYWNRAFTQMPSAYMVQTGILRTRGNAVPDTRSNAVRDGFLASQAIYDPLGKRSGYIETRGAQSMMTIGGEAGNVTGTGATDYYISSDAAHPTQDGHNFIGDTWSVDLLGLIAGWS